MRKWVEVEYPKKQEKKEKAKIYSKDGTGLRTDHQAGPTYTPGGKTPITSRAGK
jgi:hypothetical protein